jgi:hypothetical protein
MPILWERTLRAEESRVRNLLHRQIHSCTVARPIPVTKIGTHLGLEERGTMNRFCGTTVFALSCAFLVALPLSAQQGTRSGGQKPAPNKATTGTIDHKSDVAFDFRGIRVGMSLNEARALVEAKFPAAEGVCGEYSEWSCRDLAPGVNQCHVFSWCSHIHQSITLDFVDDSLSYIAYQFPLDPTIAPGFDEYDRIKPAVLDKYGKPKSITSVDVQTKAGAHYKSEDILWDNSVSTVELEQLCADIQTSCLTVTHKQLDQEKVKRVLAATKPEV